MRRSASGTQYTYSQVFKKLQDLFQAPTLTPQRVKMAYSVAVTTDVLQFFLGPLGWMFGDEVLDIVAMAVTTRLLGFHPLLLPTFILEFLPVSDMLPTWTGCVAIVVAIRKRQQPQDSPPLSSGRVIDI